MIWPIPTPERADVMPVVPETQAAVRRLALDLLARREHGRMELSQKLRRRGAAQELIDSTLDRLEAQGLLDESRYLQCYVSSRARAGYGPLRIREELIRRGLACEAVEQAVRDSGIDWAAQLREVWQRKFAGQRPADVRAQGQQGRFLSYRGYPADMVGRLLKQVDPD